MAGLKDKIENGLNETRILVLGIQILIGFAFRGFFEPGFEKMAYRDQMLELWSLLLMLVGLGILMIPAPYHRIVLHGRNTAELHRLTTATVTTGLLPFAVAIALSLYLAAHRIAAATAAIAFSGALFLVALFAWYGWPLLVRTRRHRAFQPRCSIPRGSKT